MDGAAAAGETRRRRNVSHDIISEIFLRLPVKSLLRLRCVSKTWRSLISDPEFMHSHHRRSQRNPLVLTRPSKEDDGSGSGGSSLTLFALTDHGTAEKYATFADVFMAKKKAAAAEIWSSPDLLCVRQGNRCTLLNPATREQAVLPAIPPAARPFDPFRIFSPYTLGFGYVPTVGRFKAVKFFARVSKAPSGMETCCDVLTLGVDRSWRLAEDPPFFLDAKPPVVVGGVLHKLGEEEGVAALDLESETWRVVPFPAGVDCRRKALCRIRESLCLSLLSHGKKKLQLWELTGPPREAGGGNCWAKKYSVDCSAFPTSIVDPYRPAYFSPVATSGDWKMLKMLIKVTLIPESANFWYNPAEKYVWYDWYDLQEQKFVGARFPHADINSRLYVYAENYLPLN